MAATIDIKDQQRSQWRDAAGAWDRYFEWYSQAFAPLMLWCADAIAAAPGMRIMDVAAGSGQPTLTIAPRVQPGGTIVGIDFSPEMVAVAERRARQTGATNVSFRTMDAEQLELPDASFDAVTCACGLIFFPDVHRALTEMRRVLKPGGRIAFATWPPEHLVGRMFAFIGRNSPPLPAGVAPPPQWGNPATVSERLGARFDPPFFARGTMAFPALSIAHYRLFMEHSVGPMQKLVESLTNDPAKLALLRAEYEALAAPYYVDNVVQQDFLLTRAQAR